MQLHHRLLVFATAASLALAGIPASASAQGGWLDRAKERAKEKIQNHADAATDSLAEAAAKRAEDAVKCVVTNLSCIRKAEAEGKAVVVVNAQGQAVTSADSARAVASATRSMATPAPGGAAATPATPPVAPTAPDGSVSVNQDFTPGTRVIWQTDFARDPVGDFPRSIQLKEGNFETAAWQGRHFLRTTSGGSVIIPLPEMLPQQFTLEFDYTAHPGLGMVVEFSDATDHATVEFSTAGYGGLAGAVSASSTIGDLTGQVIHCQVMADGRYVKTFINGLRTAQVPNAELGRSKWILFYLRAGAEDPAYLTNIRVAAGGKNMYEALTTEGRFTTHDILFATGSAQLDPRSTATLAEIGKMLQEHADLRVEIDGHTDNVGAATANMTLSDRRAAAVKTYLVSTFQIDASRLGSRGYGASQPVAPNTTADGRQQNRRVELVKQ